MKHTIVSTEGLFLSFGCPALLASFPGCIILVFTMYLFFNANYSLSLNMFIYLDHQRPVEYELKLFCVDVTSPLPSIAVFYPHSPLTHILITTKEHMDGFHSIFNRCHSIDLCSVSGRKSYIMFVIFPFITIYFNEH